MDLAEEEHRLRDEWLTYAQAGFRLRRSVEERVGLGGWPDAPSVSVSVRLSMSVHALMGAPRGMAEDASRWLVRWSRLLGELAMPGPPAPDDDA